MREEIEAGLKNAVERGDTLEDAINSFINAGYNPVEVKEAAKNVSEGASGIVHSQEGSNSSENSSTNIFNETKRPFQKPAIDNLEQIKSKFDSAPLGKIDSKNENPQISPKQDLEKAAPKKMSSRTIIIGALIALIFLLLIFLVGVIVFKDSLIAWLSSK